MTLAVMYTLPMFINFMSVLTVVYNSFMIKTIIHSLLLMPTS